MEVLENIAPSVWLLRTKEAARSDGTTGYVPYTAVVYIGQPTRGYVPYTTAVDIGQPTPVWS